MRIVSSQELSNFKILPFDLYNESNEKILAAGEVLTPGKLILLKNYSKILTEEYSADNSLKGNMSYNDKETLKKMLNFTYETLNPADFETPINKDNTLKVEVQVKIKYFYKKVFDLFLQGYFEEGLIKLSSLVNILITDVFKQLKKSNKGSQIRFLGEYEICHPLNVAIVSGMIAKKLEYSSEELEHVILAGLLHDIGKFKINLTDRSSLLTINEEEVVAHTKIGYDIIKNTLGMSEIVAKAALEHHENNDGSGYPQGLSSDYISEISQIVNVANYYDNLACNRTQSHITSNRDALRVMLEVGTKRFSAKILYSFVHMFTYDDPKDFSDMIL